jgi:hypothetical protein
MGSGSMMYIPSFIKIGPGIEKLPGGGGGGRIHIHTYIHTYRQTDSKIIS